MAEYAKWTVKSNLSTVSSEFTTHINKALEECGLIAEGYSKLYITDVGAVDTGRLRNSITHRRNDKTDGTYVEEIGSAVEYAPYIELGTGIENVKGGTTKKSWIYCDKFGNFHRAFPQKPRAFLKPAVADHLDEYKDIIESELKR